MSETQRTLPQAKSSPVTKPTRIISALRAIEADEGRAGPVVAGEVLRGLEDNCAE